MIRILEFCIKCFKKEKNVEVVQKDEENSKELDIGKGFP
jgi:hypothetical protein